MTQTETPEFSGHTNIVFFLLGTDFSIDSLPLPLGKPITTKFFYVRVSKNNRLFSPASHHLVQLHRHLQPAPHLPLTTQYLRAILESPDRHPIPGPLHPKPPPEEPRPLVYDSPTVTRLRQGDTYIRELMTYIEVAFAMCASAKQTSLLHSAEQLASMDADGFYRILAQYKFILAFENAVCDDYITEKFWRPLKLGSSLCIMDP